MRKTCPAGGAMLAVALAWNVPATADGGDGLPAVKAALGL